MKRGKVYLIGAGPGDPGLITVKGLRCLRKAEVVVYDYLANEELLQEASSGAEVIYVGKKGGTPSRSQNEINALIVEKAAAGKIVARLKGGDPFIFGRGGEEAEALAEAGIPFEVVPGVTSAIAVPAYAGIPLTHRKWNSSVAFVTGHEDPTKGAARISWDKWAGAQGTLVFLMGGENLPLITSTLLQNGRDPATPVALIRWGTVPEQETLVGQLGSIADRAQAQGMKPPLIIVVGEVVELRQKLNWFETLPLFGKKILVTRAREQASGLSARLRELGAMPIEFPTIEILPPESWTAIDHCLSRLAEYDWLVFTSANGVRFFMERIFAIGQDIRDLKGPKVCAIGPQTKESLEAFRIKVDWVPLEYRAEAILEGLCRDPLPGKKILIPRAAVARDILPLELKRAGAEVDVVEVYRTVCPKEDRNRVMDLFRHRAVSAITFTSSSTVSNFVEILGQAEAQKIASQTVVACIGPVTAEKALSLGIRSSLISPEYTIPSLVQSLVEYFAGEQK